VLAFNGETDPGTPSGGYDRDALRTYFDQVLGMARGITICCASGDDGSRDRVERRARQRHRRRDQRPVPGCPRGRSTPCARQHHTSAAAPLWSALIARINQALGAPVGLLNPLLYTTLHIGVLRELTRGSNGAYAAGTGWDACTGFGSPGGTALMEGLQKL
jgi:hypothetical protein